MMSCAEFARWLSSSIDGVLAPEERRQLEGHLEGCAHCRGELASLQQMLQTLRAMEPPTVPELLPGIHRRLEQAPWWRIALQRFTPTPGRKFVVWGFTAPWPASLPWHGLALVTSTALVLLLVVAPAYRVRRIARLDHMAARSDKTFQLAQAPAQASQGRQQFKQVDIPAPMTESMESMPGKTLDEVTILTGAMERDDSRAETAKRRVIAGAAGDQVTDHFDDGHNNSELGYGLGGEAMLGMEDESAQRVPEPMPAAAPPVSLSKVADIQNERVIGAGPLLLQLTWRVADLHVAASQVSEWVNARHGLVAQTNEYHLSIRLPRTEVAEFLRQFATQPPKWTASAEPLWVTIALELVPSE